MLSLHLRGVFPRIRPSSPTRDDDAFVELGTWKVSKVSNVAVNNAR